MNSIELKLTHNKKVWFFYLPKKITVGFSFINQAILIACDNAGIEVDKFFEWAKKNQTLYFSEMIYATYIAYCQQ